MISSRYVCNRAKAMNKGKWDVKQCLAAWMISKTAAVSDSLNSERQRAEMCANCSTIMELEFFELSCEAVYIYISIYLYIVTYIYTDHCVLKKSLFKRWCCSVAHDLFIRWSWYMTKNTVHALGAYKVAWISENYWPEHKTHLGKSQKGTSDEWSRDEWNRLSFACGQKAQHQTLAAGIVSLQSLCPSSPNYCCWCSAAHSSESTNRQHFRYQWSSPE